MTKKILKRLTVLAVTFIMGLGSVFANNSDYGALGSFEKESYTLEEMLVYSIEDEYLARSEYEKIMETFGEQRPFSNIVKAEEYHIELLKPIFEEYEIDIPDDKAQEHVHVPESLTEAYETGVQAEINNIKMYETFLAQDIPDDVKYVFELLKNASENHLEAFQRNLDRSEGVGLSGDRRNPQGKKGRGRGGWNGQRGQCVIER
ncbi:hypothetical protein SAMN02745945_01148 [Peptoclostridium litorale DSM 5388]|uniref:DUF2202 domain-containing protein n=1 Tax=Peptoclostridium litorale DSM 5388 TaxID=1121324 RepID=A0A069RCH7_PEPLI|nr:DUF2202 domain-containing protein [Peptoclostridium litorale]KDR93950.1 hypothetical protein CLIT_23c02220 [Peptoclostridium litorale DSM 5388]KDR95377.1 hypothetical protein CLIT_10c01040 [Peptoclostridium litorale DSM 5388]SIN89188.1 hypothetical protein SAMN02745945_01148 [Peptoclostridium litorale DSM 5388]